VRLLIKTVDNDGRLSLVSHFLETPWEFEVVDVEDLDAFERALERADAMVSMNWRWDVPATARLKLLQLPGAGTDDIDFSRLPSGITICNCFEHEIGIRVRPGNDARVGDRDPGPGRAVPAGKLDRIVPLGTPPR
jgi:hypothetical protein